MTKHGRPGTTQKLQKSQLFLTATTTHWTRSENSSLSGNLPTHSSHFMSPQTRFTLAHLRLPADLRMYVHTPLCVMITRHASMCRSWVPDRTAAQAKKYIAESMGTKYAEGVILDMEGMFEESSNRDPLTCFLSMGSDPTNAIEALAKKKELGT